MPNGTYVRIKKFSDTLPLNDEVLNNEDIDDDDTVEEGDDDDAGEDQRINSAVNIFLYWYKMAYCRMCNFCGKGK